MVYLDDIFSEENISCYSQACIDLAMNMADTRKKKYPFDTLVIPSRGAFPFFLGMVHSLDKLKELDDTYRKFYEGLAVQPILSPLLPKSCDVSTDLDNKDTRVLLIPFTADLNIPKFDPSQNNNEYVKKTRIYWANVTSSFFGTSYQRDRCPYFRSFTDVILRGIEGRGNIAEMYEKFPQIKRFAMIDTVISGRASNDILQAFDNLAVQKYHGHQDWEMYPRAFLIVDDAGRKLEKHTDFNKYLRNKEMQGAAFLYPIPRIVSEDENAALLGVSATVYPSLMRDSKRYEHGQTGQEFFIGAGSWHINTQNIYMTHFNKFMDLIYSGINAKIEEDYFSNPRARQEFEAKREEFIAYANDIKLLALQDEDISLVRPLKFLEYADEPRVYETGSHVLHVPFEEKYAREISGRLSSLPHVRMKPCPAVPENLRSRTKSGLKAYLSSSSGAE